MTRTAANALFTALLCFLGSGCRSPEKPVATSCPEDRMENQLLRFRETTNPTLSDREVGISNLFERDLPDASGAIARRVSASLSIYDPATRDEREEIVVAGSEVTIGADRYCVVAIDLPPDEPGWVSFRKLATPR